MPTGGFSYRARGAADAGGADTQTRERRIAYPPDRARPGPGPSILTDRFVHEEATAGFRTAGDTDATLIRFSGAPDRIEVFVRTFGAVITFVNDNEVEESEVVLGAGVFYESGITAHTLLFRNETAGSNAIVQAVGKWAG